MGVHATQCAHPAHTHMWVGHVCCGDFAYSRRDFAICDAKAHVYCLYQNEEEMPLSLVYVLSLNENTHIHINIQWKMSRVVLVAAAVVLAAKVAPGTPFTIYETHFKNTKAWQVRRRKKRLHRPFSTDALDQGCVDMNTHTPEQISHKLKMTLHPHIHSHSAQSEYDNLLCISTAFSHSHTHALS